VTPDLVILGAGIAGRSIAWAAAAAGLTYRLLDPALPEAGSPAALALVRLCWHAPAERPLVAASLACYADRNLILTKGALTVRRGRERPDPDWLVINTALALAGEEAEPLMGTGAEAARLGVVDCRALDGRRTWGATLALGPRRGLPLTVWHLRPYHSVALVSAPGYCRFGSSTAPTRALAVARLLDDAAACGVDARGAVVIVGQRAALPCVVRWEGRTCRFGGFGKLGYALAPALARRVVARYRELA
jgi:hypothetical protein